MPWLPIYAAEDDFQVLRSRLNEDEDIAFLVSDGPGKWRAVRSVEVLSPRRHCLWHIPSGPLPLFQKDSNRYPAILDPFAGWLEADQGADRSNPYFGAGHVGIVWLNLRPGSTAVATKVRTIGLSSFEWIGNHYRIIGSPAKPETEAWWKQLRKWIKGHATRIPRGGLLNRAQPEIWTMAAAHRLMQEGALGANS
jgi:hypothetical protein